MNTVGLSMREIATQVNAGATFSVSCKKLVEDLESYPEENMRAVIVGANVRDDEVMTLKVNYSEFDEFNKALEKSNYYDKAGQPTLTAREANQYKVIEELYMHPDFKFSDYFELLDPAKLHLVSRHAREAEPGQSYISWLEAQVIAKG